MFSWLKPKTNFLHTDLHSHLIPDIDDGVKSWNESLDIIQTMSALGYKKIITTPHIIHNYYPNTPDQIKQSVVKLNQLAHDSKLDIIIEAGAEYFVDEHLVAQINSGEELLSFGENYILIETGFMNKPVFLEEVIFNLQAKGMKPILAHPERYTYLQNDFDLALHLYDLGVLLQININSLSGYYSKPARQLAKRLIEQNRVQFLGSDIHNHKHLQQLQKTIKTNLFQQCGQLELLNSTL